MKKSSKKYVIGVDGGGTKTITALADLSADIFKMVKTGASSPRNVGIQKTAENTAKGINKVLKKNLDIVSVFIGLPAVEEEYKPKIKKIEKEILKSVSKDLKIKVVSDQLVAFRSGTEEKTGVIAIAGTGSVVHGWRGGREAKASGWGWLTDEGSAVWVGRQVLQKVFKDIDDREPKTELTRRVLKELKISTPEKLAQKIYKKDFLGTISSLSVIADKTAEQGDKIARKILRRAGEELALSANTVVRKLDLKRKKFPLILVGSMFNSSIFRKVFELYVKETCSKADLIYPKDPPVLGAVKLAIEQIK